jgi:hypothetical protein
MLKMFGMARYQVYSTVANILPYHQQVVVDEQLLKLQTMQAMEDIFCLCRQGNLVEHKKDDNIYHIGTMNQIEQHVKKVKANGVFAVMYIIIHDNGQVFACVVTNDVCHWKRDSEMQRLTSTAPRFIEEP